MINTSGIVQAWRGAIEAAKRDKSAFTETGEICSHFFTGSAGFMWEDGFRQKHMSSLPKPGFQITIAKGFELVSIVGPTLVWSNPGRYITGYEKLDIPPEIFPVLQGMQPDDPAFQEAAQSFAMEQSQEASIQDTANALMQHYLNYSQREQPGGGLKFDSQLAVIDALVKGRGCIRVDAYNHDGDEAHKLTGGFYMNVDDLFIDPDCTRANLSNAKWMAIRHCEPHWEVERRFGWPEGSLKGKGVGMSKASAANAKPKPVDATFKATSSTNDLVVWFEIFSKCGVGTRFKGAGGQEFHAAFESAVGDHAYICIAAGVDELLNFRNERIEVADMDQVGAALDWPIPYYKDGRWPVAMLDFWYNPSSAWPLAPLAMGLGELMFLNVFISSLAGRVYRDGLDKIAIRQELCEDATSKLLSLKHEVLELNPTVADNINQMVSYLQRPQLNIDVWKMVDEISMMFDKRVGLMELMYGLNPGGKVSRTAADANIKGDAVGVRPEFMASQVEDWQTEIANIERIAAGYTVSGDALMPLFGRACSGLWDQLITQADPTVYMRQMRSRVEANSVRRPNKARENQNIQSMTGYLAPLYQWYAGQTGNTEPLNNYIHAMGKAIDMDTDDLMMPPIQPPQPSPEEVAAQQAEAMQEQEMNELEKTKKIADIEGKTLSNTAATHKMLEEGIGLPQEMMTSIEPEDPYQRAI